jgi:mRNA-degrading endonuclease RelE of RelBE toxin-antitoxin system
MRFSRTSRFDADYRGLPGHIQKTLEKQLRRLLADPRHPSLRARKMAGVENIWEARITKTYRMTFSIEGDVYLLRRVGTHSIYDRP